MICADVQTLARAAPEPTTPSPKVSFGDDGGSFDQFLQAVKTDRPTGSDSTTQTRSSEQKRVKDTAAERDEQAETRPVDDRTVERKPANEKKADQKPVDEKKPDNLPADEEKVQAEAVEESNQEAVVAALIAQAAAVAAAPVQQTEAIQASGETAEAATVPVAVQVPQNNQNPVVQLPESESQPLPDELKQSLQQPSVEVKDFQNLVNNASQALENQAAAVETPTQTKTAAAAQVDNAAEIKTLDTQEPAVKVVDITAQADDLVEINAARNTASAYAMANSKAENLVQPKALPIIQKVSTQVADMVKEHGQSMRLQIHPENLGKIDLRLVSNSDGMRVVMTAEVPATAKLLETHLDQLHQSLANAGVSISGMSVNSQGAQGQFANASQNQTQNTGRSTLSSFQPESEIAEPVIASVSSSGLDYRV